MNDSRLETARMESIQSLQTAAGSVLCVVHPTASDEQIAQSYELMRPLHGATLLIFRLRVPPGLPRESFLLSEELLLPTDYEQIDQFAFRTAEQWHANIPTAHHPWEQMGGMTDTELGWLVEYRFGERLLTLAKQVAAVRRAVARTGAGSILQTGPMALGLASCLEAATGLRAGLLPDESRIPESIYERAELTALRKPIQDHLNQLTVFYHGSERALVHDSSFFRHVIAPNIQGRSAKIRNPWWVHPRRLFSFLQMPLDDQTKKWTTAAASVLQSRWEEIEQSGLLADAFVFQEANLYDAVRPSLCHLYTQIYPGLVGQLQVRKVLMETTGVSCALMNTDVLLSKKLEILAARKLGIPTLAAQHGVKGEPNGEETLVADRAAVWGQAVLDGHIGYGNDPDPITVTGNPKYDMFFHRTESDEAVVRDTIVFAAQVAPMRSAYDTVDEETVYADTILDLCRRFPTERFVIKLHPRQSNAMKAYYRQGMAGLKHLTLERERPITELLTRARLLITESSTVGFEAVMLSVPMVTINLTNRPEVEPFSREGVAVAVRDKEQLEQAVAVLLNDPESVDAQRKQHAAFIEKYLYRIDGMASRRLLALCVDTAGKNKTTP